MRYWVYYGYSDRFERHFDDGKFILLKKGIVTAVSDEISSILDDCKQRNEVTEVTGIDKLSNRNLEKI